MKSKQGRPPRNSEKGALRCGRQAMLGDHSISEITRIYYSVTFTSSLDP